jgi:tetratricopeptide (TPR) repeat protein
MRARRNAGILVVATHLAVTALVHGAVQAGRDVTDTRIAAVEQWLKAILHHTPGETDDAVLEISSWSGAVLGTLRTDEAVLGRLMRDPTLSSFVFLNPETTDCPTCQISDPARPRQIRPPERIRYAAPQLHRLQVLACAAAGLLETKVCVRLKADQEIDGQLTQLATLAAAATRRGDANYVLRRGALLHADVAMLSATSLFPLGTGAPKRGEPVRVHIVDGQQTIIAMGEHHWAMARALLDAVRPAHDAMVMLWYRATGAWMQNHEQYDHAHLDHARELFPNDADLMFLSGCERETYAGPAFQSFARGASLPFNVALGVGSEDEDLKAAEALFRKALALNPRLAEGRVRLGHVLLARGKPQDAADELRAAAPPADNPLLRYFRAMFMGRAEEALGHASLARGSYAQAALIYPRAQSPYVALSALATGRGDRAGARVEMQRVFDLDDAGSEREDPWWAYWTTQARNTDELLEKLWRPFRETQP